MKRLRTQAEEGFDSRMLHQTSTLEYVPTAEAKKRREVKDTKQRILAKSSIFILWQTLIVFFGFYLAGLAVLQSLIFSILLVLAIEISKILYNRVWAKISWGRARSAE